MSLDADWNWDETGLAVGEMGLAVEEVAKLVSKEALEVDGTACLGFNTFTSELENGWLPEAKAVWDVGA